MVHVDVHARVSSASPFFPIFPCCFLARRCYSPEAFPAVRLFPHTLAVLSVACEPGQLDMINVSRAYVRTGSPRQSVPFSALSTRQDGTKGRGRHREGWEIDLSVVDAQSLCPVLARRLMQWSFERARRTWPLLYSVPVKALGRRSLCFRTDGHGAGIWRDAV